MPRRLLVAAVLLFAVHAVPLGAQVSRADSAAVLLDAARRLDAEGRRDAATAVYDYILRRFAGTAAAAAADSVFSVRAAAPEAPGSGRVQLIAWGALYGAFMGVAVPAALDANSPEPYGVGLLLGGPGGFFLAQRYASARRPTAGQAGATTFGFRWGAWQGLGWRAVLELGSRQECFDNGAGGQFCSETEGRAPWTAMVVGGLGGLAAGAVAGNRLQPTAGRVAFASHGAYWGSWAGLVLSELADQQAGDDRVTTVLIGGNLGLLTGAIAAPRDVSAGRVWLTSALGIAGVAAGFGLDLIILPDDADEILAIPLVTGAAGLAYGWYATRGMDRRRRDSGGDGGSGAAAAILERCGACGAGGTAAWRTGAPQPMPGMVPVEENARGRRAYRPAVMVPVVRVEF